MQRHQRVIEHTVFEASPISCGWGEIGDPAGEKVSITFK